MNFLPGRKNRAWWPFTPVGPNGLGRDRRTMGFRTLPNGKIDPIGVKSPGHPSESGTTATPRNKRRTPKHSKGVPYPGMWK